ncbi:hypothetical protein [Tenacibaculum ovolyticum]|uniref:hypothetical protein n=1 Tax=Tenacibaculum ovolyticum TaxID=104270 RepID=UPI0007EDE436|nr:hypothetical protein [Tenacibaculum ovolyticum]
MGSIITKAKNIYKTVEENHITKAGGTITKTAEQIDLYTTEEGIGLYSNTSTQYKTEGMLIHGTTGDIPEPVEILSTDFMAAIQFYRTKEHAEGNYGTKDSSYKGEFGFDGFDAEVHAKGMSQYYKKLASIQPKAKELGRHTYYCPYISLWPPQPDKNPSGAVSSVTLYIKAEEAIVKKDKKGKVNLKSSNEAVIKVPTAPIELELGGVAIPVKIECLNIFETEVYITVTIDGDPSKKVGKLIVYPNKVRYKTIIQPVEIKFSTTESKKINKKTHESFFTSLEKEFNKTSFNQAYIHGELAKNTYQITLAKSQFGKFFTKEADGNLYLIKKNESDPLTSEYSSLVENRFAALLENKGAQNKAEEQLKKTIENLLTVFDNEYKDKGKVEKQHKKKIVTNAWGHPKVQKAYKAYQKALKNYQNTGEAGSLNKTNTIHVFYSKDIHAARNPTNKVLAYSNIGEGVVHVFDAALIAKKPYPDVLHEMGHSLGLAHTFSDDLGKYEDRQAGKVYKEDLKKEIKILRNRIDRLKDRIKELNKNNNFNIYSKIETATRNRSWFLNNINKVSFHFLNKIDDAIAFEKEPFSTDNTDEVSKLSADVVRFDVQVLKLQEKKAVDRLQTYPNNKSQSNTLENYMDYPQAEGSSVKKPLMERKVFYKWQWDTMRSNTKFLNPLS